jgi:hypothetical protein
VSESSPIPAERIERRILQVRGQKVLLDFQLAELYGVPTKVLNQAVKRNAERFPEDFMFQLSHEEGRGVLRSQVVTLDAEDVAKPLADSGGMRSQIVTASEKRNVRFRPYAFTEQGVAMLSSVLRSPRAILVNIAIMRTFVQLRRWLSSHVELSRKLAALERKHDARFKIVFDAIRELMKRTEPASKPQREIGFHTMLAEGGRLKTRPRPKRNLP